MNQSYILGWIYGRVVDEIPDAAGNLPLSAMRPFTAMAQVISKAHLLHDCSHELDREIESALVDVKPIDIVSGVETIQSLEMQSEWQRGYNTARSGKALNGEFDIHRARKKAGMTQKELADELGVTQPFLSAIEKGSKKPSQDVLNKAMKIFK